VLSIKNNAESIIKFSQSQAELAKFGDI